MERKALDGLYDDWKAKKKEMEDKKEAWELTDDAGEKATLKGEFDALE